MTKYTFFCPFLIAQYCYDFCMFLSSGMICNQIHFDFCITWLFWCSKLAWYLIRYNIAFALRSAQMQVLGNMSYGSGSLYLYA